MSKDKVADWSLNPNENTDIGGMSLNGNVLRPSQIPDVFGRLMAQVRAANDNYPTFGAVSRARLRNRAVNPAFQMAQENGITLGTVNGYRPADNWWWYFVGSGGAASIQRVQARSLNGSLDQLEHKTVTAKPTLAANDNVILSTALEGSNVADFEWGTAKAKAMLVDFEVSAPAGTYSVHVSNLISNRNYITPFVVAANENGVPVRKTVKVPGDVNGTWDTGNAAAMVVDFVLAAGPSLVSTPNTWAAQVAMAGPGQKNILDTAGATVRIADVAIYPDLDGSGLVPRWEAPDLAETERWCHRYYWKLAGGPFVNLCNGMYFNSASWTGVFTFPVTMRAAPAVSVSAQNAFEAAGAAVFATTAMGVANPGTQTIRVQATVAGATAGQGAFLRFGSGGGWIAFSSRLLG